MKELEKAVVAAFNVMAESGALQKIIEEKISKTVAECVGNVLGPYSDFGKNLKEHVEKALQIDMKDLGLVGYNETVLKVIRAQLDHNINVIGVQRIEENLSKLLADPPVEIRLSELVEQMKKHHEDRDHSSECTCIVEDSSYSSLCTGYKWVYLDKDGGKSKRECDIELAVTGGGEVYSFNIDGKDPSKSIFTGPFYGFERVLFQMYAAKTKLILDEEEVYTSYEQYDD